MRKVSGVLLSLLALAGCTTVPAARHDESPCVTQGEASYACQVKRYHDVAM